MSVKEMKNINFKKFNRVWDDFLYRVSESFAVKEEYEDTIFIEISGTDNYDIEVSRPLRAISPSEKLFTVTLWQMNSSKHNSPVVRCRWEFNEVDVMISKLTQVVHTYSIL